MAKRKKNQPAAAPSNPAQDVPHPPTVDASQVKERLQRATELPVWEPWHNKRELATCMVCGEQHQHPLSFVSRVLRRGHPSPEETQWLLQHLAGHEPESAR